MDTRDFLLFRLAGPMAAFGDIAVGEWRGVWGEPSKSGVLGLVAAALGLTREAEADHLALESGLGFAVRIDAPGQPLRDYHTAQAPKAGRNRRWRTRQEELAERDNLNTVLSERIYRVEARATVALWRKAGNIELAALAEALARPRFVLSLGRKSCPPAELLRPLVLSADSLLAAFDAYDRARRAEDALLPRFARPYPPRRDADGHDQRPVWFELDAGLAAEEADAKPVRQRRDAIRRRSPREFTDRREGCLTWRAPDDKAPDPAVGPDLLEGPDLLKGIVA